MLILTCWILVFKQLHETEAAEHTPLLNPRPRVSFSGFAGKLDNSLAGERAENRPQFGGVLTLVLPLPVQK